MLPLKLDWVLEGDQYWSRFPEGFASITLGTFQGEPSYFPQIYTSNGDLISEGHPFNEFEIAEDFTLANLIVLNTKTFREPEFIPKLIETIESCISLLLSDRDCYHRVRLQNIINWFKRWKLNHKMIDADTICDSSDWENHVFDWQQVNDTYQTSTIHGLVTISPDPIAGSGYSIKLQHPFGMIFQDFHLFTAQNVVSKDFFEAETRLREVLANLEETFIDEQLLDAIVFTLEICQHSLRDGELMPLVRIRQIETWLCEALP